MGPRGVPLANHSSGIAYQFHSIAASRCGDVGTTGLIRSVAELMWVQWKRSPLGRAWYTFVREELGKLQLMESLTDKDIIHDTVDMTEEEVRNLRSAAWEALREDRIDVDYGRDANLLGIFDGFNDGVLMLMSDYTWEVLFAIDEVQFALSDHPVAFVDPYANSDEPVISRPSCGPSRTCHRRICPIQCLDLPRLRQRESD